MEPALDVRSLLRDGVVEPAPQPYSLGDSRELREYLLSLAETIEQVRQHVSTKVASELRYVAQHLRCAVEEEEERYRSFLADCKAGVL